MKGCSSEIATEAASKWLKKINLESKAYNLTSDLSHGMKRKLCLAISCIGGSKV